MLRPPAAVAATVITLLPKLTGTVAEKDPSAAAVVLVTDARRAGRGVGRRDRHRRPGVVVPVTVVEAAASVLPGAGAVMVTGSEPGGPWVT